MAFAPPSPPMIAAKWKGGTQTPRLIVLHSTVSECKPGGAYDIARFFQAGSHATSAHYVVDPANVVQMVLDHTVAYHCGYNQGSIGIEMCDQPSTVNFARWSDDNHKALLQRTATLVAELCLAYDIPVVFRTGRDLLRNRSGITTHFWMSRVFKRSSHWDPGTWPRRKFMAMVRAEVARLSAAETNVTLRVTVANVKSNPLMPNSFVEEDVKKIAATKANIFMGQEIEPAFYKSAWRALLPQHYQHNVAHENAVSVGPHFHVTKESTPKRSPGITHIQPTRFDTIVETQWRGMKVAVVNMHTISEAWTHDDETTPERQTLWERHLAKTRADVARLQQAGYFVLVGGDLNNPKPTTVGAGQVLLVNEGLIQLYVCPPSTGGTAHLEAIQRIKGHTDHPILAIKLTLEKQ